MRCPNPTTRCNKKSQEKSKSGHDAHRFLRREWQSIACVCVQPCGMGYRLARQVQRMLKSRTEGISALDYARAMTPWSCSRSALDELQGPVWVEEDRFPCWREP